MGTDALTIGDLVAAASLDSRLLAGSAGVDREVLWAHSCEMSDPERWLGPHELLMTVGLCVPVDALEQKQLVVRLDEAGLAGMMIGDHEPAPPLSPEMLAEADRRGFPILLTGPLTPYAVVARHVAAATSSSQLLQVLTLSKLYHLAANEYEDTDALVGGICGLFRIHIDAVDSLTGTHVFSFRSPAGASTNGRSASRSYPLRGSHSAKLVLTEFEGEEIDSFLLVHLMKVLEVAVDRTLNTADRRSEVSERLLLSLLDGLVPPDSFEFFDPHQPSDGFQLVAFPRASGTAVARLTASRHLSVAVGASRGNYLSLVPVAVMPDFRALVAPVAGHAGISSVFTLLSDTRIAAVEAGQVLEAAQHSAAAWSEYEGSKVSLLTRSAREANEIIRGVLGPLAADSSRAESMRETLFAYLRNDRKWSETAAELSIHRQTLSYRLGRIETETGLDLSKSADLSSSWIAYHAWKATHDS